MNKLQSIVVNHYLDEYDKRKTFEEILESIMLDDGTYTVWEPYEELFNESLVMAMESLYSELRMAEI